MDFLLCTNGLADAIDTAQLDAYCLSRYQGALKRIPVGDVTIFAAVVLSNRRGGVTIFDGYVADGDRLYHPFFSDAAENIHACVERDHSTHGVFALVNIAGDGSFSIHSDAASQYVVFYWSNGTQCFVSNNSHLIEVGLRANGYRVKRSARAIAFSLAYGTNFGQESGVEGVSILPARYRIERQRSGVLELVESHTATALYASDEDYRELLDRAEQRLRQTAIAVCESPVKEVVCDLTGGVDSRLTLASFLAIGQRRRVRVFCTAKYPRADRIVVDHLANKYGLRGATVALDNQLHDLSFEDKARRGVFRTFGLKLTDSSDVGELVFPQLCRVSGYFGEMSRSFGVQQIGRLQAGASPRELAELYFANRDAQSCGITREARAALVSIVADYIGSLLDSGVKPLHVYRVMYCEHRSRFHFGLPAQLSNNVRVSVHPLYSLAQMQAASQLSAKELLANKVGFDLIVRLAGIEYALEPRAEARWSPDLLKGECAERYRSVSPVVAGQDRLAPELSIQLRRNYTPTSSSRRAVAPSMIARGRSGRFVNIPKYQAILLELLPGVRSDDDLWSFVDRDQAWAIATADPEDMETGKFGPNGRLVSANVATLAGALIWYTKQESACAVNRRAESSWTD